MNSKTLKVVGGGQKSNGLANDTFSILKEEYNLEDIKLFLSKDPKDFKKEGTPEKDKTYPLVIGPHDDSEARVECGDDILNEIKGGHIALIKHITPSGQGKIDSELYQVRSFLDILAKDYRLLTAVFPYIPYVRAHSVEKYRLLGVHQADTLGMMIDDLWRGGIDELIGIDTHSNDIWTACKTRRIWGHGLNPFQQKSEIDYTKLNIDPNKEEGKRRITDLQPFLQYYKKNKNIYSNIKIVAPDSGGEDRAKQYAQNVGLTLDDVAVMNKKRIDAGKVVISGFKPFSKIQDDDVKGNVFVIIDDMMSSVNTADEIAIYLKDKGAKRVELWCTHDASTSPKKIGDASIDKMVVLDTIAKTTPKVESIKGSDALIAASLYKSYMAGLSNM